MTQTPDRDTRHNARMARKKDVVDDKIAAAQAERGVLLVNSGNGKGKSSAGFGLVARALGHGMRVGVVQFIKGRSDTGEEAFFRSQPGVASVSSTVSVGARSYACRLHASLTVSAWRARSNSSLPMRCAR